MISSIYAFHNPYYITILIHNRIWNGSVKSESQILFIHNNKALNYNFFYIL